MGMNSGGVQCVCKPSAKAYDQASCPLFCPGGLNGRVRIGRAENPGDHGIERVHAQRRKAAHEWRVVRGGKGHAGNRQGVRRLRDGEFAERSEEHTSELQSLAYLVCRLLLEKKNRS